jgi:hypothetical protein
MPFDELAKDEKRMIAISNKQKAATMYRPGLSNWFR